MMLELLRQPAQQLASHVLMHLEHGHRKQQVMKACAVQVNCPSEMANQDLPNVNEKNGKKMLELLRGISGAFRPGILTCLMGVSGAGGASAP